MHRPIGYVSLPLSLAAFVLISLCSQPRAVTSALQESGLTVAEGFNVERVAGPPLVNRPIVADFDDEGRLYVADSSGSNDKIEIQREQRPHRIVRLEDTDGDGRFDTSVVFADRMMLPEGAMWLDGSLYVAAPPSIWKLTDTSGDGVADSREEWFQGKTVTGCANDLHGPYLGPDGWIYWTKGAFAEQTYDVGGTRPFVTRASHIFRRRPGNPAIEVVMTGGMDNPVDVAFTDAGERILTATFVEHPQRGRRDALLHAVYGGVYGKPHGVLDGHTRTGDLMPVLAQLGPAVPAGLTRYASRAFGSDYRDSFFAAMFNLHKVVRFTLEAEGATFTTRSSDFLVSNNRDFHPTDVVEDADGSLLVIDTGPWYKLCCPTSQLAKPDVLGGIYRIRRSGAPRVADARGRRLAWNTITPAELTRLLDDTRVAVRTRAVHELGRRGSDAVPALRQALSSTSPTEARRNAVWSLTRIDSAPARDAVRIALNDRDDSVRQAAVHSAGVWRDRGALPQLLQTLKAGRPAVQRAAAEALGRIGDSGALPHLFETVAQPIDRVLEHSLTYAVVEIGDPAATVAAGLRSPSSRARRAALIALDQIDGGGVDPGRLVPLLDSPDPVLKETAWWIAARHPEWGSALAAFFESRLTATDLSASDRDDLSQKLAQFAESSDIQNLLGAAVEGPASSDARRTALRAMASTRVKVLPSAWVDPLTRAISDRELTRDVLLVVRAIPASKDTAPILQSALLHIARDEARPLETRLEALAAVQGALPGIDPDVFDLLMTAIQPQQPVSIRTVAAGVIEKARFDPPQLQELAKALERAGPLEVSRLLPAFDNASDEALGLEMLAALERSPGRSSLRPDLLRARLAKYPEPVQKRGEALLAALNSDSAAQARRLEEFLATTGGGDVRRGQAVFNSDKAACSSCHAIGYLGGTLGPDLTRIGEVRGERDLLEAILFPSASFARGYEPMIVTTMSGRTHSGVLRSERPDEVVIATAAQEEIRIPRREMADMRPATISLMPAGLDGQLTRRELADLLAFLKATRRGAN